MKIYPILGSVLSAVIFIASPAYAATLYSEDVTLSAGWNIVSTPRVLDSHSFSAAETSANFDVYVLNGSTWSTMAGMGQAEFTPLYGYFVNNKTGINQTLTFNYKASTTPNERLFSRSFTQTGWYSIGVANPTYALERGASSVDSNNVNDVLFTLGTKLSQAVDFTPDSYATDPDSLAIGQTWDMHTQPNVNTLNDFRETKAYAVYITDSSALYTGFQNDSVPVCNDGLDNDSDGSTDLSDVGCVNGNDSDEFNVVLVPTLSVSMSASPASQNITAGTGIHLANILLSAVGSQENVRISTIPTRLALSNGALAGHLNSCQLWDGGTALNTGSNVLNSINSGTTPNNFILDNSLIVSQGTIKTLSLKCGVSGSAAGTFTWSISDNDTWGSTGVTSGFNVTETFGNQSGGTMTVAAASLSLTVDASSPSYALVAGGATNVTLGVIKLRATSESVLLTKLGLARTSGQNTDFSQINLYNGATLIGTASFMGSDTYATSTLSTPLSLASDTDVLITVRADLTQPTVSGSLLKMDPANAEGTGVSSGSTINSQGATAGVAGVRIVKSYPTLTLDTLSSTGVADGRLIRFKVTSNSSGAIGLNEFTFSSAMTSLSIADLQLFAYTDSSYSSAISGQGAGGQIGSTVSSITTDVPFTINPTSNPVQVPAGSTYYFELRGSVSGVTSGSSAVTKVLGDSSFDGMGTATGVTGNLIWSPNTLSTSVTTDSDWTNGYGLTGLPSSGLIQTRSN